MTPEALRYRQVHLDFHTSEKIEGIGSKFEPTQFQEMLKRGHVDSITLFSKCHHGLSYHDTEVGCRHPHLVTDLLQRQMEACAAIDVKTPIYLSAGLDEWKLREQPAWATKSKTGETFAPLKPGFKSLCFNTPYLDYLCAQIEEVVDKFGGGDGIFLDIISAHRCFCTWCLADMEALGLNAEDDNDVVDFSLIVLQKYLSRTTAVCRKRDPELRVFHNSGHVNKGARKIFEWNSHLELESLPTGGWGYDHFPVSAKYAATLGTEFLGMSGKFHTTWGEFGGFKRPAALRYECAAMLAFGARCSIGDQLHPSGEMNADTYELIGSAYAEVEARQSFCEGARPVSDIAIVSTEALYSDRPRFGHPHSEEGAARMLLELHTGFDVVDHDADFSPYKLLILPDELTVQGALAAKIEAYAKAGGKLLLSGHSGFGPAGSEQAEEFVLDIGLVSQGRSEYDPDYVVAGDALPTAPVRGPFVVHGGALNVAAVPGAQVEVLATRRDPYFNRAWNHFCSHQHTPDETVCPYPAVVGVKRDGLAAAVYFAHNIFTRYRLYGQPLYRDLVADALAYLIGQPAIKCSLPSTGRASLMKQSAQQRYVLHLLNATPVLRGGESGANAAAVQIIEDLTPLDNVTCSVSLAEPVSAVRLAPKGTALPYTQNEGRLEFTVPSLVGSQMVELAY